MNCIQILSVGQRPADLVHTITIGIQYDHLKRTIVIGVGHDIVDQLRVILDTGIDKNELLGPVCRRCAMVSRLYGFTCRKCFQYGGVGQQVDAPDGLQPLLLPGLRVRNVGVCMQGNGLLAAVPVGVGLGFRRRSLHPRAPASGEQQAGLEWLE